MCDLWARLFDDITWTVTCGRSTRKDSLMLQVCSLHQAETAAAQRIQELDSYLREVRVMWYPIGDCSCSRNLY